MKTPYPFKLFAVLTALLLSTLALPAQSIVDFYLVQFTGVTNDTTINIRAQTNPVIYNGNYYWLPQNGINLSTTNGFASVSLIPSSYTVSFASVSQSWTITVTNSATALNAADLTTDTVIYNGINNLSGPGVTSDGHGDYVVTGTTSNTVVSIDNTDGNLLVSSVTNLGLITTTINLNTNAALANANSQASNIVQTLVPTFTSNNGSVGINSTTNGYGKINYDLSASGGGGGATNAVLNVYTTNGTATVDAHVTSIADPTGSAALAQLNAQIAATNLVGIATNAFLQQIITPQMFGAFPNGQKTNVTVTASNATITGPAGTWSSADIGKAYFLTQDALQDAVQVGTITAVPNSSSATLSITPTNTGTFLLKWGTDATAGITNAINKVAVTGGILQISAGDWVIAGPFTPGNHGLSAIIHLPATFIRATTVSNNPVILVDGGFPALRAYSSQSNGPTMSGAIFDVFSQPANQSPTNCIFEQNCTNSDFATEQFTFQNLTIRQKVNPWANCFDALYGGSFALKHVTLDTEFAPGYLATAPSWIPTNNLVNPNATFGIIEPGVNNNAGIDNEDVMIQGYPVATKLCEHSKFINLEVNTCGTAWDIDCEGPADPAFLENVHCLFCSLPFYITPYHSGIEETLEAQGVLIENHGLAPFTCYDPSNCFWGKITFNDDGWIGSIPPNLDLLKVDSGQHWLPIYGPSVARGITAGPNGANPVNLGCVFDLPFYNVPGQPVQFYTWDTNNWFATMTSTTYPIYGSSPDGPSVQMPSDGSRILFNRNTNLLAGLNTATVDILCNITNVNSSGVKPFLPYNQTSFFLFNLSVNGTTNYFTMWNTNGTKFVATNITSAPLTNQWNDYTATYDGTQIIGYINGIPGTPTPANGVISTPSGAGGSNPDYFYIGEVPYNTAIAHLRVWSYAFGQAAVQQLVQSRGIACFENGSSLNGIVRGLSLSTQNGLTNLVSTNGGNVSITIGLTNLWAATNLMAGNGALDCSKPLTTCVTNASFALASPSNLQTSGYNQPVIYIHNTSGSPITITAPANCNVTPGSSLSCTNNSMATLFLQPGVFTNLTITAIN